MARGTTGSATGALPGEGTTISIAVNHRPRARGVSNYGVADRLWIGILDLFGVWWLIRRKKPTPAVTEVL